MKSFISWRDTKSGGRISSVLIAGDGVGSALTAAAPGGFASVPVCSPTEHMHMTKRDSSA